tara:strand:- start:1528 stop:1812 length:285 start_codon:yes stop_codon:yes gene_type:complete
MKLNKETLKQIIKEELDSLLNETTYSVANIFMDFQRQGGRDYWLSQAHGTDMKFSDFMHADQALAEYIRQVDPSLKNMPQDTWSQITELIRQTV